MAGLNRDTHTSKTYVTVSNGKFVQRVDETTEGAVKRIIENKKDKTSKTVFELIYGDIDANLDSIEIDESGNYGDQLKLNMSYIDQSFTVTLPMNGREAKAFLCALPNINLNHMVILKPYNFVAKDDGKQKIGMVIYQGGKEKDHKVAPFFSREAPNGLPQVPEGADTDEFKLVMKAQEIFLKKFAKKFALEKFSQKIANSAMKPNPVHNETPPDDFFVAEEDSELPF